MTNEDKETLRVTYEQLNEQVRSREASTTTVMSILLPASLLLATLSFDPNIRMSAVNIFPFFGTVALPGASILIGVLALVYWITGHQVDSVYWVLIHNLEGQLGISEGHTTIWKELQRKRTHHIRVYFFPIMFAVVLVSYALLFLNSL